MRWMDGRGIEDRGRAVAGCDVLAGGALLGTRGTLATQSSGRSARSGTLR
jgi:hypothetical protein